MFRAARTALASVIILAAPNLALAGDTTCIWRGLPETLREAAIKSYIEVSPESVGEVIDGSAEVVGEAMIACVAIPKSERAAEKTFSAAGGALAAYMMQAGSETYLKTNLGIEPAALERAWAGVDKKHRKGFVNLTDSSRRAADATSMALVEAMLVAYPEAPDDFAEHPAFKHLTYYLIARAMREEQEAKF